LPGRRSQGLRFPDELPGSFQAMRVNAPMTGVDRENPAIAGGRAF